MKRKNSSRGYFHFPSSPLSPVSPPHDTFRNLAVPSSCGWLNVPSVRKIFSPSTSTGVCTQQSPYDLTRFTLLPFFIGQVAFGFPCPTFRFLVVSNVLKPVYPYSCPRTVRGERVQQTGGTMHELWLRGDPCSFSFAHRGDDGDGLHSWV